MIEASSLVSYILKFHRDHEIETREVAGPSLVIGRGASAQLRLDDGAINFEHAQIDQIDGNFIFSDKGGAIGSYINGLKLQIKQIADGDRISIGPYLLVASPGGDLEPVLTLNISTAAQTRRESPAVAAPRFDYTAAYGLYRRYWNKTVLTLVLLLVVAALLLLPLRAGMHEIFQPAAVATGHAIFSNQCTRCHEPWRGVGEIRCQECHGAGLSIHQKDQPFTPSCLTCHVEHRHGSSLVTVGDAQCSQCHADLRTKSGGLSHFAKKVTNFSLDHPEFTVPVKSPQTDSRPRMSDRGARQSDPSTIKLNHQVHLKPNLKGANGNVQLSCKDCHQPVMDGTIMLPVKFSSHCQSCHPLEFDANLPDRAVPHQSPEIVDAYLSKIYSNQAGQAAQVGAKLFKSSCVVCHELEENRTTLPVVKAAAMPAQWFASARFSHGSHRVLECGACHTRASKSRRTSDVLIPGIQICQECHKQSDARWPAQPASAPTACLTCHDYHQRSANPDWDGPLNLRRFREPDEGKPAPDSLQPYSYSRYLNALTEAFRGISINIERYRDSSGSRKNTLQE